MSMFEANPSHPVARVFLDAIEATSIIGMCSWISSQACTLTNVQEGPTQFDKAYDLLHCDINRLSVAELKDLPADLDFYDIRERRDYPVEAALGEVLGKCPSAAYHDAAYKMNPDTPTGQLRRWWAHNLAVVASRIDL